jgi:hypothetical protein
MYSLISYLMIVSSYFQHPTSQRADRQASQWDASPRLRNIALEQWLSTCGTRTPWGYAVRALGVRRESSKVARSSNKVA